MNYFTEQEKKALLETQDYVRVAQWLRENSKDFRAWNLSRMDRTYCWYMGRVSDMEYAD